MTLGRTMAAAVAGLFAVTAACQSMRDETTESGKAAQGLHETRAELISAKRTVERAMSNLDALQNERRDVRPPYERVRDDVGAIEASFHEVTERTDELHDDATQYRREWMESTAGLTDPDLRASAEERNKRIRERYDSVNDKATEARAAYEPFIQRLRELEAYLSHDLTPEAVQQAEGSVENAKKDAQKLVQRLDDVIAEIEDLALEMNTRTNGI